MAETHAIGGFLSLLGPDERRAIGAVGRPRAYRRGDLLFLEGDRGDAVYLVVAGQARVFTATAEGNEVTLSVRGPGDLIGEMSALDPGSLRSASVVALDPLRCRVISSTELQTFLEAQPRAAVALLRLLIGRLREADRRRTEFGSYDATRRLARILIEAADEASTTLAREQGLSRSGSAVGLALSQRELAGLIGASRESVARALAELRRRNLVDTGRRAITIRDPVALRRYAG
ncbi:MAG: Crp/Fnr family transcriptional regulator [Acidimicrobiales bacterium]